MKRKLCTTLFAGFIFSFISMSLVSCSNDDTLSGYDVQKMIDKSLSKQWQIVNITINKKDWHWKANPNKAHKGAYFATINLPELTQNIFNEGAVIAYFKENKETKTALPYIRVYDFEETDSEGKILDKNYTEYISCDFKLGSPSTVTFFVETSDRARFDNYLIDRLFQVVLIW